MVSDQRVFEYSLLSLYLIVPTAFIALRFFQIPFGKHNRSGCGPTMSPALAWFIMESPHLWVPLLLFPFGLHSSNPKSLILMSPLLFHYFHRTCIYPLRQYRNTTSAAGGGGGFPVSVMLTGIGINILNSYVQSRWVSHYKDYEGDRWFWWRFLAGLVVFVGGMAVNLWSDGVLLGLKKEGRGYKVPRGGWFELVSCPNYFGEIVEWFAWALMTWSWSGLAFFFITCATLLPRARATHRWYLDKFGEDYPKVRKAVIPFLY